jgi:hypothetical protein
MTRGRKAAGMSIVVAIARTLIGTPALPPARASIALTA